MFVFITIFFIPVLGLYANNSVNALAGRPKAFFNMWSLGNYGSSSVRCKHARIKEEKILF